MNARIMYRSRCETIRAAELCIDDQIDISPLPDIPNLVTVTGVEERPGDCVRVVYELESGAVRGRTFSNRDRVTLVRLERTRT